MCGHNGTSLLLAPLAAFAGFHHDGDDDEGDDDDGDDDDHLVFQTLSRSQVQWYE